MFDCTRLRRALSVFVVCAAPVGAPMRVEGQEDARLEAARRATAAAHRALMSVRERYRPDSTRRFSLPRARVYSGLVVLADSSETGHEFLAAMDTAHANVLREARALFGPSADTLLTGQTVFLTPRTHWRDSRRRTRERSIIIHSGGHLGVSGAMESGSRPGAENLERLFVSWFSVAAGANLSPALRRWMRPVIPLRPTDARTNAEAYDYLSKWEYTHEELHVARACLNGSVPACRSALALVVDGDSVGAWMDAGARRRLGLFVGRANGDLHTQHGECEAGDDRSCRIILARYARLSPTTAETRMALVRQAIVRGGAGAYERLVASRSDTIARSLELAAGVPLDSLVAAWRENVLQARRPSPAPTGAELLVVLVTGALIVTVASGRRP